MKALLVIDVQKFFINDFTKETPKRIAKFLGKNNFDLIVFSKFVFNEESGFARYVKHPRLVDETDTSIVPELEEFLPKANVLVKSTFSLFKSKELLKLLKGYQVDKLYICGFDTDGCVYSTALEAFDLGYDVKVIGDLCASHHGKSYHKHSLELMERNIHNLIVNSEEV